MQCTVLHCALRCQLVPSVLRWLMFYCKPVVRPSASFIDYWKRARRIRLPPLIKYSAHCTTVLNASGHAIPY